MEQKKTAQSPQVWAVFYIAYSQNLLRLTGNIVPHLCKTASALEKGYRQVTLTFRETGI
jgi:hypothetical protein